MTDKLPEGVVSIHGTPYTIVAKRVKDFRDSHGTKDGWGIETEILEHSDVTCLCRAKITKDGNLISTGHAYENVEHLKNNMITSLIEIAETSAVGRALAFCGYGGSEIASAEDVQRAQPQVAKIAPKKKREIIEAMMKAVDAEDGPGLLEVWEELDQSEQIAIWGELRSYERAAIKALLQTARDAANQPDPNYISSDDELSEKDQRRSEARDRKAN